MGKASDPTIDSNIVAERILAHIDRKSTDSSGETWREPVANYRSPQRLAAELSLFRRTPTPFCPSAALAKAGDYVAREAAGVPLVAVRGADGKARVFRNACRHRGTQVAQGSGCAKSFVCPYHAWTYELDGRLRHVPHEKGFPGLDKSTHGLVPVHAEERLGMIWVNQDGGTGSDDPLPVLLTERTQLYDSKSVDLEVNWKVLLEGFVEGYHIRYTHPETFFPYGFDNLNLVDFYGRSSRITYPFRRIEKLRQVPAAERKLDGLLTFVYHVFPNVLVIQLSRHTSVLVLEPLGVDRTRQHSYVLANDPGEAALEEARRDSVFVTETGLEEDRAVVKGIQQSLGSGANEAFLFGHFESCIVHFHRAMHAALGG